MDDRRLTGTERLWAMVLPALAVLLVVGICYLLRDVLGAAVVAWGPVLVIGVICLLVL